LNTVLFTECLLHVSTLTAPLSGITLITSQNHLLIVRLLQWLSYRAEPQDNIVLKIMNLTKSRWFWEV